MRRDGCWKVRVVQQTVNFHSLDAVKLEGVFGTSHHLSRSVLLTSSQIDFGERGLGNFQIAILKRRLIAEVLANRIVVVHIHRGAVAEISVGRNLTGDFFNHKGREIIFELANLGLLEDPPGVHGAKEHLTHARIEVRYQERGNADIRGGRHCCVVSELGIDFAHRGKLELAVNFGVREEIDRAHRANAQLLGAFEISNFRGHIFSSKKMPPEGGMEVICFVWIYGSVAIAVPIVATPDFTAVMA